MWDVATGQPLLTFEDHAEQVTGVGFTPDGRHLLSSSHDGTLVIREADAWE